MPKYLVTLSLKTKSIHTSGVLCWIRISFPFEDLLKFYLQQTGVDRNTKKLFGRKDKIKVIFVTIPHGRDLLLLLV